MRAWPGQTVLCVSQVYWTKDIHEAIGSGQKVIISFFARVNICSKLLFTYLVNMRELYIHDQSNGLTDFEILG